MIRAWALIFAFVAPVFAGPLDDLVGPSKSDSATVAYRFELTRDGETFRVRFEAIYGRTRLRGVVVPATREELEPVAELVQLVPVGPSAYYLLNPASRYFHVRFEPGQASSTEVRVVNGRVVTTPYVPEHVVLEVAPTHGTRMVQLHFLQRKGPEVFKTFIFSGLHMDGDRAEAKTAPCVFDFGWEG